MKQRLGLFGLAFLSAICGCDPVAVQYPPTSAQYPYPNSNSPSPAPQPSPAVSSSQRWQHAWSKAMEGIVMGGSLGGPYGAGGGLIVGLITGLITADSHYGQINNQIYTEQKKDQQLEAAIEQELAHHDAATLTHPLRVNASTSHGSIRRCRGGPRSRDWPRGSAGTTPE